MGGRASLQEGRGGARGSGRRGRSHVLAAGWRGTLRGPRGSWGAKGKGGYPEASV